MESVHRCQICNKPFNQQSTLKRHGYYCRTRNQSGNQSDRSRACVACVKAKVRCVRKALACTRCASKNLDCMLPLGESTRRRKEQATQGPLVQSLDLSRILSKDLTNLEPDPVLHSFDSIAPQWESPGLTGVDLTTPLESLLYLRQREPRWALTSQSPSSIALQEHLGFEDRQTFSILPLPSQKLRYFEPQPCIRDGSKVSAMLMTRLLIAYPTMMQSQCCLPPFIHPLSFTRVSEFGVEGSEALTICLTLVQMANANNRGSKKLLWKNVGFECERIQEEMIIYDKWELLSSMQALLIYILVRLREGQTTHNHVDMALFCTVLNVSKALNITVNNGECAASAGLAYGDTHDEWVFEESRRRISIVFICLKTLFTMEPLCNCSAPDGFSLSPLPKRKQLWQAKDQATWSKELAKDTGTPSVFGLTLHGRIKRMREAEPLLEWSWLGTSADDDSESESNWQEWCAGIDEFGSLVMLAASLVA